MPTLILTKENDGPWKRSWQELDGGSALPAPKIGDKDAQPADAVKLILGQTVPIDGPPYWENIDDITSPKVVPWYGQALYESGDVWPPQFYGLYSLSDGFIVASQWIEDWEPNEQWPFPPPHLRPRFHRLDSTLRQFPQKWGQNSEDWQETRKEVVRILGDLWALFSGQDIQQQFVLKYQKTNAGKNGNKEQKYDVSIVDQQNWSLNIEKRLELEGNFQPGIALITTLRPAPPPFWLFNNPPRYKHQSEYVVVASPNYQSVLEEITRIFRVKRPKSVLIVGPPGCGKEILFDIVTHGLSKGDGRYSVAGLTKDNQRESDQFQAFIRAYKQNTIVIDEVDKCHRSVRDWLLRILETDKLDEKDDLEGATWVMAASRPVFELRREVKPLDFWTRIQFTIEVKQPLDVGQQIIREQVLLTYFKFFWSAGVAKEPESNKNGTPANWLKSHAAFAAKAAADAAHDARRYDLSVRELRAMTDHVFHEMKSLHYEKGFSSLTFKQNDTEKNRLRDAALRYLATVPL